MKIKPSKRDREFRAEIKRLRNEDFDNFITSGLGIATSHFFEGVRTNGHARRATILDDLEEMKLTERHIRKTLVPLLLQLQEAIDKFEYVKCRSCKGEGGTGTFHGASNWMDCLNCKGLGFFWPGEQPGE